MMLVITPYDLFWMVPLGLLLLVLGFCVVAEWINKAVASVVGRRFW